jgi:tagatose 6-phosphate kinase
LNVLDLQPWMIKPNLDEFRETFSLKLPGTAELKRTMLRLVKDTDRWVVTTMNKDGMMAFHGSHGYGARVPKIKIVNSIGSGDAVSAGFAIGKIEGWDDKKMIKFANACGIANALVSGPGRLKPEDVALFEDRVEVFDL